VDSAYTLPASIKKWDEISQTPFSLWQSNRWNQVWWDDEVSLELKYNLAIQKKIGGVGIWALGYDGSLTNLWALIEKKFVKTSSVNTEARLPDAAELHQNYPNPFSAESGSPFDANRSTVISWQMNEPGFVSIKIYDLLGREITELVNEFKEAGNHRFVLDATKLTIASGTYFYTLRTGGFSSTKKMVLIR
jgi:hypothetical protein